MNTGRIVLSGLMVFVGVILLVGLYAIPGLGAVTGLTSTASCGAPVGGTVICSATANGGTNPYTYLWNFGDGGTSVQRFPTYTYTVSGTYTVVMTATDSLGATAVAAPFTVTVTVPPTQIALTVNCATNPGSPIASCSATATGGSGGYRFVWNFGDGLTGTGRTVTHTYQFPGAYNIGTTVTDSNGNTASQTTGVSLSFSTTTSTTSTSTSTTCTSNCGGLGAVSISQILGGVFLVSGVLVYPRKNQ